METTAPNDTTNEVPEVPKAPEDTPVEEVKVSHGEVVEKALSLIQIVAELALNQERERRRADVAEMKFELSEVIFDAKLAEKNHRIAALEERDAEVAALSCEFQHKNDSLRACAPACAGRHGQGLGHDEGRGSGESSGAKIKPK